MMLGNIKTQITSLNEPFLKRGIFFIDLLFCLEPLSINYLLVNPGISFEQQLLNAKYVINTCWKFGISIPIYPIDIIENHSEIIIMFLNILKLYCMLLN